MSAASEITAKAKSNLAFALKVLPSSRRDDMVIFYAFCRQMDDLADGTEMPVDEKRAALEEWRRGLESGFEVPTDLQMEVAGMRERHSIPVKWLLAIIDGCISDLKPQRFGTWEDLSGYTWKVAGAVGLISVRLFGCKERASDDYAVELGNALQLTNILRDVREDLENGVRIYLPLADLARFQYTERDLVGRVWDGRFLAMMRYEAERARGFFVEAERLMPFMDRKALKPARMMADIYRQLLEKMIADDFQVFTKRYRVGRMRKLTILLKHLIAR